MAGATVRNTQPGSRRQIFQSISFFILAAMVLFAPLVRGANRPLPLMILELMGMVLLVLGVVVWRRENIPVPQRIFLSLLAFSPLIYLLPLPISLFAHIPGRELYAQVIDSLGSDVTFRAMSIYPNASLYSWLALLLPIVVFLHILSMPRHLIERLVFVIFAVAVLQSLLSMLQYAQGPDSFWRFGMTGHLLSGTGTYPNRNHLAGFLEMFYPMMLLLLFAVFMERLAGQRTRMQWRSIYSTQFLLLAATTLIVLLGLVFSRSRTGIGLLMLGMLFTIVIAARHVRINRVHRFAIVFIALLFLIAAELGLLPILERFTQLDPLDDSRWTIFAATWEGIKTFFPFGAGPGNFSYVFPRFQPEGIHRFVNYAHNDYLEWLFEMGVIALVLLVVAAYLLIKQIGLIRRSSNENRFALLQLGAGVGIILIVLHSLVDFNLHIPANMIYFAVICGVFFHKNSKP